MRGALDQAGFGDGFDRIIPAYAGSTSVSPCRRGAPKDHPRVCGEHGLNATSGPPLEGSSPRMRGAPCRRRRLGRDGRRIIPAYAGSTRTADTVMCLWGDHSAYAGSTVVLGSEGWQGRDHPRVCGEHILAWLVNHGYHGSSPRMRGAPGREPGPGADRGIIPAYAGSTYLHCDDVVVVQDHPRVCGEHWVAFLRVSSTRGSSPRMRGARIWVPKKLGQFGIIPAYAGST